jgi:hypothetical protein
MSYDVEAPSAARLWPYAPDWVRTFDVNRSYLTDIVTSRDNTEQRRALRDQPRLSATYQTTLSGSDRQAADHHMRAWQNEPVVVPDFARWARLTGSSSGGSSALTISPMPAWVAAGQPLVLCKSGVQEEVIVDSAGGSTLNSIEVFTLEPDYVSPPSISDIWPVEEIDYGRGRTAQFRPVDRYARGAQYMFSGLDVATATELEQFFDRMKGRRTAFYLPTGEKDFTLAASAGSGASAFTASGSALASDFGSTDYSIVNEGVAVFLTDGSALYRRISDISASGGNSVVTVGSSWGVAISTANVARISRMPLTRFDADDMTTSWRTPLSASAQLPFLQVKA